LAKRALLCVGDATLPSIATRVSSIMQAYPLAQSEAWCLAYDLDKAPGLETPIFGLPTAQGLIWSNRTVSWLCLRADTCELVIGNRFVPIAVKGVDLSKIELSVFEAADHLAPRLLERLVDEYRKQWRRRRTNLQTVRCLAAKAAESGAIDQDACDAFIASVSDVLARMDKETFVGSRSD
jgi:hypothetical protein